MKSLSAIVCLLLSGTLVSYAGYRNVDDRRPASRGNVKKAEQAQPPGGWSRVEITRRSETNKLAPRGGLRGYLDIEKNEEVTIRVRKPEVPAGAKVMIYTVHGGVINGKRVETVTAAEGGLIEFLFQAEASFGNYPVVIRYAGREEAIEFWVKDETHFHHEEAGR